ncbi:MAG: hypothetical protein U1E45_03660 [Geminicoccaceae bacterium]
MDQRDVTTAAADPIGREHVSTPLLHADWRYVEPLSLDEMTGDDWTVLRRQQQSLMAERKADSVLRWLATTADEPAFGYRVNLYRHSLQTATMALADGLDEETIVCMALHDIGYPVSPETHAEIVAGLLGPYVSDANYFMLLRHQDFLTAHLHDHPVADIRTRERWRGHPHFEWAATFAERYDQRSIDPVSGWLPLAAFEPMIRRLFAKEPRRRAPLVPADEWPGTAAV